MDFSKLSSKNFLVIGRAGMDIYPNPPGTKTENASEFFACLGGSSANIAVALCRLGNQASLVTSVSDDAIGRFCLNELDKYGVDRTNVKSVSGEYRTSLAVVETRVEDHQSVIYRNGAADFQMICDDVIDLPYEKYSALIITGTVFAAEPSRSAGFKALELANKASLPTIIDLDYRPYSWPSAKVASETYSAATAMCDIVIGNDVEFGCLAGDYDKGLEKARDLVNQKTSIAIYKMGEKGAITMTGTEEQTSGIFPTNPIKPTGAGDSFMGGFLSALANNHSINEAVKHGSACASIVVANIGCAPAMPDQKKLDDFLQHNTISL